MKTMTVEELAALLRHLPQEAEVVVEGCDCIGFAVGVSVTDDGEVAIRRGHGAYDHEKLPITTPPHP